MCLYWERRKRIVHKTAIVFFVVATMTSGQTGRFGHLTDYEQQAEVKFRELVRNHPEPSISKQLNEWLITRTVHLSFQTDHAPPEMAAVPVLVGDKYILVLAVNPQFMLGSTNFNKTEATKYKQLVIYHEYTHLANHLSGKAIMATGTFDQSTAAARAQNLWNSEWLATKAEWELAKRMNAKYLMPSISKSVQQHGEERGFFEAFYGLLMANAMDVSKGTYLLRPAWGKIYEREKAKLSTR
jgi:hypothetical protein